MRACGSTPAYADESGSMPNRFSVLRCCICVKHSHVTFVNSGEHRNVATGKLCDKVPGTSGEYLSKFVPGEVVSTYDACVVDGKFAPVSQTAPVSQIAPVSQAAMPSWP